MPSGDMNRREFVGLSAASVAGGVLGLAGTAGGVVEPSVWDPDRPLVITGKALRVQPVLMYRVPQRREATSWKSWGGVQSDEAAATESSRITRELGVLAAKAGFPLEVLPVVKVKTPGEAARAHAKDYDCVIVYPATGSGETLRTCFAPEKDKDTLIFARHRSGPAYYWYEALSTRYLETGYDTCKEHSCSDHGAVHVDDVVVDETDELLWRLRALYGLKNFVGARIVALGGPWGKYAPDAPQVARTRYKLNIIDVSYDQFSGRMETAMKDRERVRAAKQAAERYLSLPGTTLMTEKAFVTNAFLLHGLFRDLMRENEAPAFTIRGCMSTILPIAKTTPCLTLGVLNDEGVMAFCESDFVIIPAGILLHYISGRPVFLHNSTFPHNGVVTAAHCSAPRRLNGERYEPAKIMTHYESEYGAAPKVEIPVGQTVTFIDPEYSTRRWLGFAGVVKSNPFYEVCRSQQDVEILGDWEQLRNEVRDSHWMMVYGDCLKEIGYAARKIGIHWIDLSTA
ncbi:MAG: sugar isomerase [Planctomycetota bacterium]